MVFIVDNADNNGNSAALLGDYYSSCSTCSAEPEVSLAGTLHFSPDDGRLAPI